jgi:hypothetical protein
MKFRFWMNYVNARESGYGASVSDGNAVHVRGWDAGVTVTPRTRGREDVSASEYADHDEFDVAMTWGSHGGDGRTVLLGTVRDTEDGPRWEPAEVPGNYTDAGAPPRLRRHRQQRSYTAPAPLPEPARPGRSYPAMAYVFGPDGELADAVLTYSAEQWAGLEDRTPPGFRVAGSEAEYADVRVFGPPA